MFSLFKKPFVFKDIRQVKECLIDEYPVYYFNDDLKKYVKVFYSYDMEGNMIIVEYDGKNYGNRYRLKDIDISKFSLCDGKE